MLTPVNRSQTKSDTPQRELPNDRNKKELKRPGFFGFFPTKAIKAQREFFFAIGQQNLPADTFNYYDPNSKQLVDITQPIAELNGQVPRTETQAKFWQINYGSILPWGLKFTLGYHRPYGNLWPEGETRPIAYTGGGPTIALSKYIFRMGKGKNPLLLAAGIKMTAQDIHYINESGRGSFGIKGIQRRDFAWTLELQKPFGSFRSSTPFLSLKYERIFAGDSASNSKGGERIMFNFGWLLNN